MITMTESNRFGVTSFSITNSTDITKLSKRGYATGSTAILYGLDGNIRIWNFIANEDITLDGQWVEMV